MYRGYGGSIGDTEDPSAIQRIHWRYIGYRGSVGDTGIQRIRSRYGDTDNPAIPRSAFSPLYATLFFVHVSALFYTLKRIGDRLWRQFGFCSIIFS
jgi:hypothetical protein